MPSDCDLVSVIVPSFNCAATLPETLRSVLAQTYPHFEIIVVNDGSVDGTAEIAEEMAAADPRIRLVSQANAGVAASRNRGVAEAKGAFVAPIDSDDLWRPDKLERQMRVMRAAGEETGLVYSWSAIIDSSSTIVRSGDHPYFSGDVLHQLMAGNFVGNGSSALMRRDLVLDVGGYDASLRSRRAQGCEDWKLYLLLAERSLFALVCDHLVGYRYDPNAMSGDVEQMLRSDAIVREEMLQRHPTKKRQLEAGRKHYLNWLLYRETENRNWAKRKSVLNVLSSEKKSGRGRLRMYSTAALRRAKSYVVPRNVSNGVPFLAELGD